MIRINLLSPERAKKTVKAAGAAMPSAGALQSYLLLALFAGGAAVLCAGAWWFQSNKLKDLDTRIAADTKRRQDLQAIKQQVKAFQQKKGLPMLLNRSFNPWHSFAAAAASAFASDASVLGLAERSNVANRHQPIASRTTINAVPASHTIINAGEKTRSM